MSLISAFEAACRTRGITPDDAQIRAARRLQGFYDELLSFEQAQQRFFKRLFKTATPPKGLYFWGGVGRGKSFLMDCFFEAIPSARKRRVHFHAFMREIHESLRAARASSDALIEVADKLAAEVSLLCFDEFHVSDIADAMILGRLLEALLARKVLFCMTSNYPPDGLYPNGLQRHQFLPTIALIKQKFDVMEIDAGIDYRLRRLEAVEVFHVPDDEAAEKKMAEYFLSLAGEAGRPAQVTIMGRTLNTLKSAPGVLWFDFETLCGGPRSQNDYLEIAQEYHTVLLSHVPVMDSTRANEARRFTWLVDVFYDHRVKLIVTAQAEAPLLYRQGPNAQEFPRTVSRLIEMRSRAYLSLPHRVESEGAAP